MCGIVAVYSRREPDLAQQSWSAQRSLSITVGLTDSANGSAAITASGLAMLD